MVTDTWLTPPAIIKALGPFDLDPCTPEVMPWETATVRYTEADNGLLMPWHGRVWLNPPYGQQTGLWLQKMAQHANGVALTFARTETDMFFRHIWEQADGLLFLRGRLHFHYPDGMRAKANAGAPSCLIAYGMRNVESLEASGIPGKFLPINYTQYVVIGISPTWFRVVTMAVGRHGESNLKPLYDMVERLAPEKVARNPHWREKVRQQVQRYRRQTVLAGRQ